MVHIATIETNKAERLMKALCNHFASRITASYKDDKGYIEFQAGKCEISVTATSMTLQFEAENADNLTRLQDVVVDHLLRFTPNENIQINWSDLA